MEFNKYIRLGFITLLFIAGYYSKFILWLPLSIQAGACATLFMYIGYQVKYSKNALSYISEEIKIFLIAFAAIIWLSFIKDFQSFWLVRCDIGRGIIDVFGSLCACLVVIYMSKLIDYKLNYASKFLSYFGRYSLLVLCVHIIELDVLPWHLLKENLLQLGVSQCTLLMSIILAKITLDLGCTYILSKIRFVRNIYGIEKKQKH